MRLQCNFQQRLTEMLGGKTLRQVPVKHLNVEQTILNISESAESDDYCVSPELQVYISFMLVTR